MRSIILVLLVVLLTTGKTSAVPTFDVSLGQHQLFLDDHGVVQIAKLTRTMLQPDKKGAIIRPDQNMGEHAKQTRTSPVWNPQRKIFQF